MQVVRTIGRAFDVCHQLMQQQQQPQPVKSLVGESKSTDDQLDAAEMEDVLPDTVQPQTEGHWLIHCICVLWF